MKKRKIEVPLQNGKELKPIMIKPNMGKMIKPMAKFPDLSGDGKVTQKDILIGKGVIDKPKYGKKPKMYNKPKQQKDLLKKKRDAAIEAAIKQKKTGKTDPTILRVVGDPEKMKQDIVKLDSMRASFKSKKDSIVARGKMSAKDRAKSARDEFKDFFNNSPKMYNKPKYYGKKKK